MMEPVAVEWEPAPSIASSVANSVSTSSLSFAVYSSRNGLECEHGRFGMRAATSTTLQIIIFPLMPHRQDRHRILVVNAE